MTHSDTHSDTDSNTPTLDGTMNAAIMAGNEDEIERLLENGWNLTVANAAEDIELILSQFGVEMAIRLLETGVQDDLPDAGQSLIWGYAIVSGNEDVLLWLRDHGWVMDDNVAEMLLTDLWRDPNGVAVRILRTRTETGEWWWPISYEDMDLVGLGEIGAQDEDDDGASGPYGGSLEFRARGMLAVLYEVAEPDEREYFEEVYAEFPELAPADYSPDE